MSDGADKRVTSASLRGMKASGKKIVVVTGYDYPLARILDRSGVDVVLVGDSLGMVVLGYESTVSVTMEDMVHHTRAAARGCRRALIAADLPFLSCDLGPDEAVRNAGRLVQEGGAHSVKVEGGAEMAEVVSRIVAADIPVMGHIGLTPQSILRLGSYQVQGRGPEAARRLLLDARALETAGAFAVVLECLPGDLAAEITRELSIPTIGIGAGPACDGQVLVAHDLLGMFDGFQPTFVKRYAEIGQEIGRAVSEYAREVRDGTFPGPEQTFQ